MEDAVACVVFVVGSGASTSGTVPGGETSFSKLGDASGGSDIGLK